MLVAVLEALRCTAVAMAPATPALSARIYAQLGYSEEQYKVRYRVRAVLAWYHAVRVKRA